MPEPEELPLDDRGYERQLYMDQITSLLAGVSIEALAGITLLWVEIDPAGAFQLREHRFGRPMVMNAALLQAFLDNTAEYGLKADLRAAIQKAHDGLMTYIARQHERGQL